MAAIFSRPQCVNVIGVLSTTVCVATIQYIKLLVTIKTSKLHSVVIVKLITIKSLI